MINPFQKVVYDTTNMFGVPVVKINASGNDIDQLFTPERQTLIDAPGLLPDIKDIGCDSIDQKIKDAEELAKVWKPTPEMYAQHEDWLKRAREKQKNCLDGVHPKPKKFLSKNLTPVVVIMGAVLLGIVAYKIVEK